MIRGEVAKRLHINSETVRYYENIGLIKPEYNKRTNYRYYDEITISKLELIIRFKNFGFTLKEIKQFFDLIKTSTADPKRFNSFIDVKIGDINNKIEGLKSVKESLLGFRDKETCS